MPHKQVTKGRAQNSLEGAARAAAIHAVKKLCDGAAAVADTNDATPLPLQAMTFGLAGGKRSSAVTELMKMPCVRWAVTGVRHVIIIDFQIIKRFMETQALPRRKSAAAPLSFQQVQQWAATATAADLTALVGTSKDAVFYCTQGAHEVLYTPAGAITFEQTLNSTDMVGFKMGVLPEQPVAALKVWDVHKMSFDSKQVQELICSHLKSRVHYEMKAKAQQEADRNSLVIDASKRAAEAAKEKARKCPKQQGSLLRPVGSLGGPQASSWKGSHPGRLNEKRKGAAAEQEDSDACKGCEGDQVEDEKCMKWGQGAQENRGEDGSLIDVKMEDWGRQSEEEEDEEIVIFLSSTGALVAVPNFLE